MENPIETIKAIIENTIPKGCFIEVSEYKLFFSEEKSIKIAFAASDHNIHNVRGQKPQVVSLSLNLGTMKLEPQVFGGNGGNRIYREPNMEDAKEKYLAMKNIKIPFRKPQSNETAVLKAIERFAQNWVNIIRENKDVLTHQDLADYSKF